MNKDQMLLEYLDYVVDQLETNFNEGKHGTDREIGFVILSFPINGANGHSSYMSNGVNRKHVAKMMKNLIGKLENSRRETLQ